MKLKSYFASTSLAAIIFSGATAARSETKVLTQLEDGTFDSSETYLGAIKYEGGLLERGQLTLTSPLEIAFLRFEKPSDCDGNIFEAGTTTEGVTDLAKNLGNNRFSVNDGRGMRARSIFISINGNISPGCSVLVFKTVSHPNPSPNPAPEYGYACLTNMAAADVPATLASGSWNVAFRVALHETVMIRTNLLPGRQLPFNSIWFDGDASPAIHHVNVAFDSAITNAPLCSKLPSYQFVENTNHTRLDLIKNAW